MHSQKALPRPELSAHHHLLLSPARFDLIGWRSQHGSPSHASPAAPIWQVTPRPDDAIKNATSLRWSQSESFSSSKGTNKGAHRSAQTALAVERWAPYPRTITSPSIGLALLRLSASLSHTPAQGWFCFCSCTGLLLCESAVCSDRPQFGINLFCFLFLCPTAQLVLARPGFPPPIRPSYLQALGPQQLAWSNCLIAIPDGSYQRPTSPWPLVDEQKSSRFPAASVPADVP